MAVFFSRIVTSSDSFATNRKEMLALADDLHALKDRAKQLSERRQVKSPMMKNSQGRKCMRR